jgi:hypothetical protein
MSTATSKSPKTSSDRKPNLKGQAKVKLLPSNVAAVGHSLDIFLDDNDTSSESFNAILVHELVLPVIAQVLQSFFERVFKEVYGVEFVDSSEIDL